MRKIHEVLRLKREGHLSHRAITQSCGISHSTVTDYLRRAQNAGLSSPLPEALDEDQLYFMLFPKLAPIVELPIPKPDWQYTHGEIRRKGMTRRLL